MTVYIFWLSDKGGQLIYERLAFVFFVPIHGIGMACDIKRFLSSDGVGPDRVPMLFGPVVKHLLPGKFRRDFRLAVEIVMPKPFAAPFGFHLFGYIGPARAG